MLDLRDDRISPRMYTLAIGVVLSISMLCLSLTTFWGRQVPVSMQLVVSLGFVMAVGILMYVLMPVWLASLFGLVLFVVPLGVLVGALVANVATSLVVLIMTLIGFLRPRALCGIGFLFWGICAVLLVGYSAEVYLQGSWTAVDWLVTSVLSGLLVFDWMDASATPPAALDRAVDAVGIIFLDILAAIFRRYLRLR